MLVPSAPHVLSLWELGHQGGRAEVALAWLALAHPERAPGELAALPLGRRDRMLLDLRARLFGPTLQLRAACPRCAEAVEAALDVHPSDPVALPADHAVAAGERTIRFRLPTAADVAAAADSGDPQAALLARCVLDPRAALADDDAAAVLSAMAALDPDADITLALTCPACDHAWSASLDVVEFLRAELAAWSTRFADEVDALARAYGWSEADILRMSPARRHLYLDRVRA